MPQGKLVKGQTLQALLVLMLLEVRKGSDRPGKKKYQNSQSQARAEVVAVLVFQPLKLLLLGRLGAQVLCWELMEAPAELVEGEQCCLVSKRLSRLQITAPPPVSFAPELGMGGRSVAGCQPGCHRGSMVASLPPCQIRSVRA